MYVSEFVATHSFFKDLMKKFFLLLVFIASVFLGREIGLVFKKPEVRKEKIVIYKPMFKQDCRTVAGGK